MFVWPCALQGTPWCSKSQNKTSSELTVVELLLREQIEVVGLCTPPGSFNDFCVSYRSLILFQQASQSRSGLSEQIFECNTKTRNVRSLTSNSGSLKIRPSKRTRESFVLSVKTCSSNIKICSTTTSTAAQKPAGKANRNSTGDSCTSAATKSRLKPGLYRDSMPQRLLESADCSVFSLFTSSS